ncbi:kinase-like domain-containing protein [Xylaria arbuscula]|nr:kinase-like domain-containing protein [Xylaria arbuscula]
MRTSGPSFVTTCFLCPLRRRISASATDVLDACPPSYIFLMRRSTEKLSSNDGLIRDPTNLDHYLGQLTPTYLHTYTELPTSIYKQCFHHEEARGSYGAVTEVEELSTGRRLAMKTLEGPKYLPMRLENYLGELVILRVCDHPNLLRVVDAFRTGERKLHFVIEPWAPYTLHSFLYSPDAERREMFKWFKPDDEFSTIKICHWMLGLAGGLGFLHDRSIKHKDIKPQNILLHFEEDSTIQPILADVGKGKVWHEGASSGYADSTRMFLAPEQIRCRDPKSTLQADVWQLGCCFAILLALACGGTSASHSLHFTFGSVAKPPNCISLNREIFLAELDTICVGKPHVSEALPIVKAMLAEEPERRLKIVEVTKRLNGLLYPWE